MKNTMWDKFLGVLFWPNLVTILMSFCLFFVVFCVFFLCLFCMSMTQISWFLSCYFARNLHIFSEFSHVFVLDFWGKSRLWVAFRVYIYTQNEQNRNLIGAEKHDKNHYFWSRKRWKTGGIFWLKWWWNNDKNVIKMEKKTYENDSKIKKNGVKNHAKNMPKMSKNPIFYTNLFSKNQFITWAKIYYLFFFR